MLTRSLLVYFCETSTIRRQITQKYDKYIVPELFSKENIAYLFNYYTTNLKLDFRYSTTKVSSGHLTYLSYFKDKNEVLSLHSLGTTPQESKRSAIMKLFDCEKSASLIPEFSDDVIFAAARRIYGVKKVVIGATEQVTNHSNSLTVSWLIPKDSGNETIVSHVNNEQFGEFPLKNLTVLCEKDLYLQSTALGIEQKNNSTQNSDNHDINSIHSFIQPQTKLDSFVLNSKHAPKLTKDLKHEMLHTFEYLQRTYSFQERIQVLEKGGKGLPVKISYCWMVKTDADTLKILKLHDKLINIFNETTGRSDELIAIGPTQSSARIVCVRQMFEKYSLLSCSHSQDFFDKYMSFMSKCHELRAEEVTTFIKSLPTLSPFIEKDLSTAVLDKLLPLSWRTIINSSHDMKQIDYFLTLLFSKELNILHKITRSVIDKFCEDAMRISNLEFSLRVVESLYRGFNSNKFIIGHSQLNPHYLNMRILMCHERLTEIHNGLELINKYKNGLWKGEVTESMWKIINAGVDDLVLSTVKSSSKHPNINEVTISVPSGRHGRHLSSVFEELLISGGSYISITTNCLNNQGITLLGQINSIVYSNGSISGGDSSGDALDILGESEGKNGDSISRIVVLLNKTESAFLLERDLVSLNVFDDCEVSYRRSLEGLHKLYELPYWTDILVPPFKTINSLLSDLPDSHTDKKAFDYIKCNYTLNKTQEWAVKNALTKRISLIQGPPGTGKTYTAAAIVDGLLRLPGGNKVLVACDSNAGADNAYNALIKAGVPNTVRVSTMIVKNARLYNGELKKLQKSIHSASVIVSTNIYSMSLLISKIKFTSVVMDESTQSTETSCLAAFCRESVKRVVLIGDHKQLPATVISDFATKAGYNISIFQRLVESGEIEPVMLNVQRRMHPSIVNFPNKMFYSGQIHSQYAHENELDTTMIRKYLSKVLPSPDVDRFCFIDCKMSVEERDIHKSIKNMNEAFVVSNLYLKHLLPLQKQYFEQRSSNTNDEFKPKKPSPPPKYSVGIIVPYAAQKALLEKKLREYINADSPNAPRLVINTIDGFQGNEEDFIIISLVRSGNIFGFLQDRRRLNVMLTRAKKGIFLIGNLNSFKQCDIHVFKKLYEHSKSRSVSADILNG